MNDSSFGVNSALAGRLPVAPAERVFATAGSFFSSCVAFGAAIWVFLVGSALPSVGSTKIGVMGYAIGLVIGYLPVALSSGLPCFKYGVDTIDACKATFGVRGALIPLLGVLITSISWAAVLMAMVARGVVTLVGPHLGMASGEIFESSVVVVALLAVLACWLIVKSGPKLLQRFNDFVGPALICLAIVSLMLMILRFGWAHIWTMDVAPAAALTTDRLRSVAYAVELGVATSLAWWPFLGGLFRLVRHRKHVMTPSMAGLSVIGGAFCAGVAGLAAATMGTADPLLWITRLAGPAAGSVMVALILIANIPIMGLLIYFAAVSVQQIRPLARVPWGVLVAAMLIGPAMAAFFTQMLIDNVLSVTTYVGLQFAAISGIACVDYLLLRNQSLEMEQLFVKTPAGRYWFWGGVNWAAMLVVALGCAAYMWLYHPLTLQTRDAFRYFGASIPVIVGSAAAYFVLVKCVVIPLGYGGYENVRRGAKPGAPTQVAL